MGQPFFDGRIIRRINQSKDDDLFTEILLVVSIVALVRALITADMPIPKSGFIRKTVYI